MDIQGKQTKRSYKVHGYNELVNNISDILNERQLKQYMQRVIRAINPTSKSIVEGMYMDSLEPNIPEISKRLAPHLEYVPVSQFNFKMDILKRKQLSNVKLAGRILKTLEELREMDSEFVRNPLLASEVGQEMDSNSEEAPAASDWNFCSPDDSSDNIVSENGVLENIRIQRLLKTQSTKSLIDD